MAIANEHLIFADQAVFCLLVYAFRIVGEFGRFDLPLAADAPEQSLLFNPSAIWEFAHPWKDRGSLPTRSRLEPENKRSFYRLFRSLSSLLQFSLFYLEVHVSDKHNRYIKKSLILHLEPQRNSIIVCSYSRAVTHFREFRNWITVRNATRVPRYEIIERPPFNRLQRRSQKFTVEVTSLNSLVIVVGVNILRLCCVCHALIYFRSQHLCGTEHYVL